MLNGKPLEQYEALTDGDVLGVGPFSLNIDFKDDALRIKVSLQIGATPGEAVARHADSAMWDLHRAQRLRRASRRFSTTLSFEPRRLRNLCSHPKTTRP